MDSLFKQLQFVRGNTISFVKNLSMDVVGYHPEGFNNNIHWNYGHILTSNEMLLFKLAGKEYKHEDKFTFFKGGTKPSGWEGEVTSIEELTLALQEQEQRILETFNDCLDQPLAHPFNLGSRLPLETVRDALTFCIYHEGLHQGSIGSLLKVANVQKG
ncbi:DinB family protein [Peribacillus alkalitolerans]|uniref:DinB family protein n=1 Tax=Peribacillus alkalitolerans TaxID=1550385 RepID=UPI0013D6C810|nr:DinB family protein [Peribacillus alkalitolerans]